MKKKIITIAVFLMTYSCLYSQHQPRPINKEIKQEESNISQTKAETNSSSADIANKDHLVLEKKGYTGESSSPELQKGHVPIRKIIVPEEKDSTGEPK